MLQIKTFTVNPLQENTYIVSDETHQCVIIDCGAFTTEEQQNLIQYIQDNELTPVHILATHGHLDHNYGVNVLAKTFGCRLKIHQKDEFLIQRFEEQAQLFMGIKLTGEVPQLGDFLTDQSLIRFGTHAFKVLETPGHTPGGVTFYCSEESVAFTGDTLFKQSIGRTDLEGGDMFQMILSLRKLCQLPDNTKIYAGHGPSTTMGQELATNPYLDR